MVELGPYGGVTGPRQRKLSYHITFGPLSLCGGPISTARLAQKVLQNFVWAFKFFFQLIKNWSCLKKANKHFLVFAGLPFGSFGIDQHKYNVSFKNKMEIEYNKSVASFKHISFGLSDYLTPPVPQDHRRLGWRWVRRLCLGM
jgi:hypothetical protein